MKCPICNSKTKVIDKRPMKSKEIRRRRECPQCLSRFNTEETLLVDSLDPHVLKNSYLSDLQGGAGDE